MRFGPVPLDQAEGTVLAHSVKLPSGRLRKGAVLDVEQVASLRAAGIESVIVAELSPDDVDENSAAAELAHALAPDPAALNLRLSEAFTGRVNVYATVPGIVEIDAEAVHAANRVEPMITLATVSPLQRTKPNGMVATVKIIAYGVEKRALAQAAKGLEGAIRVRPAVYKNASLILTELNNAPEKEDSKGQRAIAARLTALGTDLCETRICKHDTNSIATAIAEATGDVILLLTASATSDNADVAPEGLRRAGGHVTRFGMPVDPGNLLFLGAFGNHPVIGLPGCARAPALNGADWVLERICCGLDVSDDDIARMGVGGLLKEIPTRPQPRDPKQSR
ncbi:molybdopterin-binding protein [Pseudohalocynthiibacter aestuariivivens]|jgi:molybdenum cofactor cytidylyltransferase|uniref:Molybdopterin-binding protein n=1 Tax=Pseudohalocynthiibacter aestuariivivens TaxID=1591409 RepID=A0ABV5JL51_9RHOB|nr:MULTISPECIES: molybdopterin-binding protein [Pseudohalocynthiibacter]MBS9716647.1 molybdopterin-binding protein [Pseudohalocynthiibacter aestuariivivens]MCK0101729.1 molybdopterin-binding protein [Pseudohalocynthiibacter sp. F2068]